MPEQFGPAAIIGILVMYLQRGMKRFAWYRAFVEKFPMADKRVHQLVAGLLAFITAMGIAYTTSGDASTGWHITIDVPNLAELKSACWNFLTVYVTQNFAYDATRRPADVVPYPAAQPVTPTMSIGGKG